MIKVLLVDDEPFILEGLSVVIDWHQEGFEIVKKVNDAQKALEYLKNNDIQLVITDIKMPEMTGLELLQKVREELKQDTYFVILSGFNDFSYLRSAIQFNCLDYLLKPINKNELLKVLEKVKKLYDIKRKTEQNTQIINKEFFSRNIIPIIYGKYDSENLATVKNSLGECKNCRYISVELNFSSTRIKKLTEEQKLSILKSLYDKCLALFSSEPYRVIYNISAKTEKYYIAIIYSEEMLEKFNNMHSCSMSEKEYLNKIKEDITNNFEYSIFVFVGNKVSSIEQISTSAKSIYSARYLANIGSLSQSINQTENNRTFETNREYKTCADALISAVELNNTDNIKKYTKELFNSLKNQESQSFTLVINYISYAILHLSDEQDKSVNSQEILLNIAENAYEEIFTEENSKNIELFFIEYASYLSQLRGNQAKGVVAQIINDMNENYKENLTLKDLSKKYYVNAAYLGQIFKKQFGESFKEHLNRIRVEKACKLLLNTDMRVYEIADEVGYKDLDYFIEKFIAICDCTPAKFRKMSSKPL